MLYATAQVRTHRTPDPKKTRGVWSSCAVHSSLDLPDHTLKNCRIIRKGGVTRHLGDHSMLQILNFIDSTTCRSQCSQICLWNDPILQFHRVIEVSRQPSLFFCTKYETCDISQLTLATIKFLTRSNSCCEKHRALTWASFALQ